MYKPHLASRIYCILEMIVDGNKIEPTYNYTFQEKGNHTVYFLINNNFITL